MINSVRNRNVGLLRCVEERALSKKVEDEQKKQQVSYLDKDCISGILIRLPLESLSRSRFVCKSWYNIINTQIFIDAHLCRSESVLIFLKAVSDKRSSYQNSAASSNPEQPNTFSVEASFRRSVPFSIFEQPNRVNPSRLNIQFMEFKEGTLKIGDYNVICQGNIRATCNGLILLDSGLTKGELIAMNPVTRKLIALPRGTLSAAHKESYGFALSNITGEYKVVHLFEDELGHISCETLILGARMWREVNGPSFRLFGWLGYKPVSAIGALHWVPHIDRNDYIISMDMDSNKFHTVPLPTDCRTHDRIIEMGGLLCFIAHEGLNIGIWSMKSLDNAVWTKQHTITRGGIIDMVPLLSLKISGELIFERDEDCSFYAYDFNLQEMRKVETEEEGQGEGQGQGRQRFPLSGRYLPHVNSLVSWTGSRERYF